jgi:hypothetical protein
MTDLWQIFQSRLADALRLQPIPAASWRNRQHMQPVWFSPPQLLPPLLDCRSGRVGQLVRLPGIQRPECGPRRVRIQ